MTTERVTFGHRRWATIADDIQSKITKHRKKSLNRIEKSKNSIRETSAQIASFRSNLNSFWRVLQGMDEVKPADFKENIVDQINKAPVVQIKEKKVF